MKLVPKHFYSWDFTIVDGARTVAHIDVSWWRERASLRVDGSTYRAHRERLLSGAYVLKHKGSTVASARKPSVFRREFLVEHDGRRYTLRARSALRRGFVLLKGTKQVGSITLESLFSYRANVKMPEDLPLPVQAFVAWLVILMWRRAASAGAAGGGGS